MNFLNYINIFYFKMLIFKFECIIYSIKEYIMIIIFKIKMST